MLQVLRASPGLTIWERGRGGGSSVDPKYMEIIYFVGGEGSGKNGFPPMVFPGIDVMYRYIYP